MDGETPEGEPVRGLRVTARQDRRFRAGLRFAREPRVVHASDLGEAPDGVNKLLAILSDPQLECALVDGEHAVGIEPEMIAELQSPIADLPEGEGYEELQSFLVAALGEGRIEEKADKKAEEPAPTPAPTPAPKPAPTPAPTPAGAKKAPAKSKAKPAAKADTDPASGDAGAATK